MSRPAKLQFTASHVACDRWPGGTALLRRLGAGNVPEGLPLFDAQAAGLPPDPTGLDRDRLARRLVAVNRSLGNPLDAPTVDAIRGGAFFIVTGQQPGLLGGPAYTLLKAVTAVQHARRLSQRLAATVLPAFWIAAEDHDLAEVDHCTIAGTTLRCPPDSNATNSGRSPVNDVPLEPCRDRIIASIDALPDHARCEADLAAIVRGIDWSSYTTQFASALRAMLGDVPLVLLEPMRMRDVLAPALSQVVARADAMPEAFDAGRALLQGQGFEPQLQEVGLFEITGNVRRRTQLRPGVAQQVLDEPERFSPGAALRPIVQDAALPVLCTIGGPGEMMYLWQIGPLYEAVGVRRSAIWPRLSATVVDPATRELADRFDLPAERILQAAERLRAFDPLANANALPHVRRMQQQGEELMQAIDACAPVGDQVVERARRSIRYQVRKIAAHLAHQKREQQGVGRSQLRRVADAVMPRGQPAERVVAGLDWFGRFGPALVEHLLTEADVSRIVHHLIEVRTQP